MPLSWFGLEHSKLKKLFPGLCSAWTANTRLVFFSGYIYLGNVKDHDLSSLLKLPSSTQFCSLICQSRVPITMISLHLTQFYFSSLNFFLSFFNVSFVYIYLSKCCQKTTFFLFYRWFMFSLKSLMYSNIPFYLTI